eukprot:NODE_562_length_6642_cov_0.053798.p3 type:complete len:397 gc:universal NODE_562_length_6642_cov_0.053798:6392-5202(-)
MKFKRYFKCFVQLQSCISMRLVKNWGIFPKLGIYQKLPNSKINQVLKLSLHKNVQSKLYYDGIGYYTSIPDTKEALSALFKGFNETEFKHAVEGIKFEHESLKWDHQKRIANDIKYLAFKKSIFQDINDVTVQDVQDYAEKYLYSEGSVVSAVGHEMSSITLPRGKSVAISDVPRYYGGFNKIKTIPPPILSPFSELKLNYFGIYFPISSVCHKDMYNFAVLCHVLGGGSAFSAGGPGKGIYSRLYQVLCGNRGVESIFANLYQSEHISLFGITMGCEYNLNNQGFSLLLNQLLRLYDINDRELERAKNQALATQFQSLEKTGKMVEYMGRSMLNCNKLYSMEELESNIEAVNKASIKNCVTAMLQAPPTCAVVGENMSVEDPVQICQRLGIPTIN